ncbi:MAG: BamA/TamA family outer membrane protein [Polaromonas sp.]|nr:BamA/TamA family outer membrane protein [Polaromonas sp.]
MLTQNSGETGSPGFSADAIGAVQPSNGFPGPGPASALATGPAFAPAVSTAFDIEVRTPPEFSNLRELIDRNVGLQRYRALTDLDDSELARLVVLAERDVRNLLGTAGYFSPDVVITQERAPAQHPVVVIAVVPNERTRIADVAIHFEGDIARSGDLDALGQRSAIVRNWRLPEGRGFTQNGWNAAKAEALRGLVVRRYPAGRLTSSLADVDAVSKTAGLSVTLDSGPLYRLGAMQVTGIERYDPLLVTRLVRLGEGAVYDQNQLVQAQQRLASSGYFDSAYVFVDPDSDPLAAPVQVQVREAALQKVVLGVGLTTDSGPRASVEHTHRRIPGLGWRAVSKLQLDRKTPFAQTEWTAIPSESQWRWLALARVERIDDNTLITRGQRLRFGRTQALERTDRSVYAQYDRASVSGAGVGSNSLAQTGDGASLSANYLWTGRYFDALPFPANGYGLGFELGGGTTLGQSRQPYLRTVGRWLGIKSFPNGRLAVRGEGGAVLAQNSARIPSGQLFRTGGDATVRGYDLRDIGVPLPNGGVGPGRYLAVGSIEWQRPILRDGFPGEWENTLFVDVGAVADRPADLRPVAGIGTGIRWRSPIGPLQADIAYGLKAKKLHFHVSVGFLF